MTEHSTPLSHAVAKLLKPLIKLLLHHGVSFNALSELLKRLYVEVAETDFTIPGKKQTISRISTLTGLSRKEVTRAKSTGQIDLTDVSQQYNRAARVISGWIRDPEFHDKKGKPAVLPLEGVKNSFHSLVRRFSGDIPARAIADELVRVGAIEKTDNKHVKLKERAYIPEKSVDEKLQILGADVSELIKTIYHNIYVNPNTPYLQRKVSYEAVIKSSLPALQVQLKNKAQKCLEGMEEIIINYDSDENPELSETGNCRVGVGIYYFEEAEDV